MTIKKLTDDVSVAPQVSPGDMRSLAALGFKAIISNRPDREGADQPLFAEIASAAQKLGLGAKYVPVTSGNISDSDVVAFKAAIAGLPKPVLAYCKTGTRSATLWSLAEAGQRPIADILARTKNAGFDVSGLANRIEAARPIAKPKVAE